jgi:hypothetical protein
VAERISNSPDMELPTDITPDGTKVIFHRAPFDIRAMGIAPPHHVDTLVDSPFEERNGAVSTDGRWLAYEGESATGRGQLDVYVRPFPRVEARLLQVSSDGGLHPVWARSGNELFYRAPDGAIMAAPVESTATNWNIGAAVKLFRGPYVFRAGDLGRNFDVSLDGRRFLMIKEASRRSESLPLHIIVVQRWADELARRLP